MGDLFLPRNTGHLAKRLAWLQRLLGLNSPVLSEDAFDCNTRRCMRFGVIARAEFFAMDRFDFKAVVPAFHCDIVITIAFFTHAANQLIAVQ